MNHNEQVPTWLWGAIWYIYHTHMHHSPIYSKLPFHNIGLRHFQIAPLQEGYLKFKVYNPSVTSFAGLSVFGWGIYHITYHIHTRDIF